MDTFSTHNALLDPSSQPSDLPKRKRVILNLSGLSIPNIPFHHNSSLCSSKIGFLSDLPDTLPSFLSLKHLKCFLFPRRLQPLACAQTYVLSQGTVDGPDSKSYK